MIFWYVCKECGFINQIDTEEIDINIELNEQKGIACLCSECDNRQDIVIEITEECGND